MDLSALDQLDVIMQHELPGSVGQGDICPDCVFGNSSNRQLVLMQVVEATTANGVCTMRIKAVPLPGPVANAIDKNAELIRISLASSGQSSSADEQAQSPVDHSVGNGATAQASDTLTPSSDSTAAHTDASDANRPSASSSHGDLASRRVQPSEASAAGDVTATEEPAQGSTTAAAANVLDAQARQQFGTEPADHAELPSAGYAHQQYNSHLPESRNEGTHTAADAASDSEHSNKQVPMTNATASNTSNADTVRVNGHETALDVKGPQQQEAEGDDNGTDDVDTAQHPSGKVGVLRQRLLAAAKEAGNGTDKMLEVQYIHMCGLRQACVLYMRPTA